MNNLVFSKFQPSNKRGVAKSCEICNKQFSVFSLDYQHQCKRCIRAVCKECGKIKRDVYKLDFVKNPHRICSICFKQSDFIIEYVSVNRLVFGNDSQIAKKWLSKFHDEPSNEQCDQKDEQQVDNQQINNKFTYQIFTQMWNSYNYSIREFIGLLTFDKNQKQIYNLVNAVYEQLLKNGYDQKMTNIMFLIVFLLCFCNPKTAYKIIQRLIKLRQEVTDSKLLIQAYLKSLRVQESQLKKISEYLNYKLKLFVESISVNNVPTDCSIHIITRIIQKSKIEEVYMFLGFLINNNIKYIINNKNSKFQCDLQIIRNCKLQQFLQKYRQISNVKTAQFIKTNNKNSNKGLMLSPSQNFSKNTNNFNETSQKSLNIMAQQNSQRGIYNLNKNQDTLSSKTLSIRQQSLRDQQLDLASEITERTQRKTQKPLLIPKFGGMQRDRQVSQLSNFSTNYNYDFKKNSTMLSGNCIQCQKNVKRIEDLQNKVKIKQREIQNLNFRLSFKRKQQNDDYSAYMNGNRARNGTYQMIKQNQEISKLERQILQRSDQSSSLYQQLSQTRKQNTLLKIRVEELEVNNKILRNNIATNCSMPNISIDSEKQQQQSRVFETLKKTLQNKNKQLEEVMKRNKLLNYQIEQMQKQYSIQRPEQNVGSREELMAKIAQLTSKICQEQSENLKIAQQLFDLRQQFKKSESQKMIHDSSDKDKDTSKNKSAQCTIF